MENLISTKSNLTKYVIYIFSLGLCFSATQTYADSTNRHELGTPLIQNYTTDDFAETAEGEISQVWSVTQDHQGVMYFGLWRNIVQFDGLRWNLIPVPSGPVRGLTTHRDGTVYVALVGNFGYLAGDEKGALSFVSLLEKLPQARRKLTNKINCAEPQFYRVVEQAHYKRK